MKFVYVIFALLCVVVVSGCIVNSKPFAMGTGVEINSFYFKPDYLISGQPTLLTLEIQNRGSISVDGVSVYLSGLSDEWLDDGSYLIGEDSGDMVSDVEIDGLRSADADLQMEGEKRVVVWKLKSPYEPLQGTEYFHDARVRVCYPYVTRALAKVEIVGENEWLLLEQRGDFSQHAISVSQTASPLQIDIESMQPLIVDDELVMSVKISNVGGGTVLGGNSCSDLYLRSSVGDIMNKISFSMEGCTVEGIDPNDIILSKGDSVNFGVRCTGFDSDLPKEEMDLGIDMEYLYYVDAVASATVVGSSEVEVETSSGGTSVTGCGVFTNRDDCNDVTNCNYCNSPSGCMSIEDYFNDCDDAPQLSCTRYTDRSECNDDNDCNYCISLGRCLDIDDYFDYCPEAAEDTDDIEEIDSDEDDSISSNDFPVINYDGASCTTYFHDDSNYVSGDSTCTETDFSVIFRIPDESGSMIYLTGTYNDYIISYRGNTYDYNGPMHVATYTSSTGSTGNCYLSVSTTVGLGCSLRYSFYAS